MKTTTSSLLQTIISLILVGLLFWGFTKFVTWFSDIGNVWLIVLSFWFLYISYRFFIVFIKQFAVLKKGIKIFGHNSFYIFKAAITTIFLLICLFYLGQVILEAKDLYVGWRIIGLIAFSIFCIQIALSIGIQFYNPLP